VHGCENVVWAEHNVVIRDSYLHDPVNYDPSRDPHTDAIQMPTNASNITIDHNTVYGNYVNQGSFGNSAIMTGGSTSNVTIDDNLLAGGGYTVYCNQPGKGSNYKLINNRFSTKYVSTVGAYGPDDECSDETAYGNAYYESGQPVAGIGAAPPQGTPTPTPTPSPTRTPTPTPTPTPSPTATPTPSPAPGGWPTAANTGVPAGTTLTASGGLTVNQAGAVIDALDINGAVIVNAPNVTIRRSRIHSDAFRAIENDSTGLVVEDSEIVNAPAAGQPNCHNAIGYGNYTLVRTEITGCENGADVGEGNVVIQDDYIHDLDITGPSWVWGNTPHTDAIQGAGSNVTVQHNTLDPTPGSDGADAAIIMGLGTHDAASNNYRILDNLIDGRGASYAIFAPRVATTGVVIDDNQIQTGVYGYTDCAKPGNTVQEFARNHDSSTGTLITPDNGAGGACED
jgi:hypothetical protein